jgi:phage protein D
MAVDRGEEFDHRSSADTARNYFNDTGSGTSERPIRINLEKMIVKFPHSPYAIVKIEQPGSDKAVFDSRDAKRLFESVDIELVTNATSQATIKFFDPKFRIIDAFSNATAKAVVTVYLGHGETLDEPVFKGVLAEISRGQMTTTFTVFDMAYKMKLEKRAGYKNQKSDLDVIEFLVSRNGLQFEGPEGTPLALEPYKALMQDQQTDWEWMTERARDSGLVIYVRQDTVFAKYPAKTGTPSLKIENGKDFTLINDFDFAYKNPENQDGKAQVVTHRRRGKNGRFIEGKSTQSSAGPIDINLKKDIQNPTKSKLTKRAQAQKDLDREHAYRGSVELLKRDRVKLLDVRNTIDVKGIGRLLSGKYLADTVNYRFSPGRLDLSLGLYRDAADS